MLKIIRTILLKFIDDIDSDNCHLTLEEEHKIMAFMSDILNNNPKMSKMQACDYIGVSRATFDNYIRNGWIPKGIKEEGFKELFWNKYDLDKFLHTKN